MCVEEMGGGGGGGAKKMKQKGTKSEQKRGRGNLRQR